MDQPPVLTARRSARISTAKLGRNAKPVTPAAPVVEVEELIDTPSVDLTDTNSRGPESLAFRRLASKNPALLQLVAALDLEETGSTQVKPEPLPPLTDRPATEPLNPKLKDIAQGAFARGRSYPLIDAVNQLASVSGVPTDRARNGIDKMYAQGILSQTLSDEYYLTDSTPF